MKALTEGLMLLAVNMTTAAETAADNISDVNMGTVIVSFLYFLGALLLIYLVLVLVNKWGKKNQKQDNTDDNQQEQAVNVQSDTVNVTAEQTNKDNKDNEDKTGENDG